MSSKDDQANNNHHNYIFGLETLFAHLCESHLHHLVNYYRYQHQELGSVALDAPEGYNHLWAKTRKAFHYVYQHHKVSIIFP